MGNSNFIGRCQAAVEPSPYRRTVKRPLDQGRDARRFAVGFVQICHHWMIRL
ncbi:hypothetical protein BURPS305_6990 [Burkholderia pseudomallei 305]|nr:hypothetical protein BURPS305_6990 [Burkholderia pseudomallei 305]